MGTSDDRVASAGARPASGPTAAPAYTDATEVVLVTTALPPATAERELRAHFAG